MCKTEIKIYMNNKLTLTLTSLWAVLAALNEAGVLDIIPLEGEAAKWFKWAVAVVVVIANYFAKPSTNKNSVPGGGIKTPPKDEIE